MIKKIKKINNFGIFRDFKWEQKNLADFKKFNLIFGWNRSGKTTISRIFMSCEKKSIYDESKFPSYPKGGTFEIEIMNGENITSSNVVDSSLSIKVFNQNFVNENVFFDDCRSNPIVYISLKDISLINKLKKLEEQKKSLKTTLKEKKKDKEHWEKDKENFFSETAREIRNIIPFENTKKDKVKQIIEEKKKEIKKNEFSRKDIPELQKKIQEEKKENLNTLTLDNFSFIFNKQNANNFKTILQIVQDLLNKKITIETIERLEKDGELNKWVEEGLRLYQKKKEKYKCLFCEQKIDENLLSQFSEHFNNEYANLKNLIHQLKKEIEVLVKSEESDNSQMIYSKFRAEYKKALEKVNINISGRNLWIKEISKKLQKKYGYPLEIINLTELSEFSDSYNQKSVTELNQIIIKHNLMVKKHALKIKENKEKLKFIIICLNYKEKNLSEIIKKFNDSEQIYDSINENLKQTKLKINKIETEASSLGKALNEINKYLKIFFGEEEIKLELAEDQRGYLIKRDEIIAKNLSEGEKTVIAFSYFIAKTEEKEFKKQKGIFFIDDPVSSLDTNYIYQCYAILISHLSEVGQLFVTTHNFRLFKLLKEKFKTKNKNAKEENKETPCEFFMLKNFTENSKRKAEIVPLDKTLLNFKNEYQFLFKKLNCISSESETMDYENIYTICNIARRFLEIFLDWKVPSTGDIKSKMYKLLKQEPKLKDSIDKIKIEKVYILLNEMSHGSDVMNEFEKEEEILETIQTTMSIVEKADSNHYKTLKKEAKN